MDLATLIGVLLGAGLIGGAIGIASAASGTSALVFLDVLSVMIVIGGTLAATAIAFPLQEVLRLFSVLGAVFKGSNIKLGMVVDDIVDLAPVARKGPKDMEDAINNIKNPFLRDGAQMVVDGYSLEEVRDTLDTRVDYREERERVEQGLFKSMGKYAPAFGMLGTLIGLVFMLKGMGGGGEDGGADMAEKVGTGMATALITTFYGALVANLFFLPMADKLGNQSIGKSTLQHMITEGVCLLQLKKHPLIVREKLNSFIPPREWKREEPGGG